MVLLETVDGGVLFAHLFLPDEVLYNRFFRFLKLVLFGYKVSAYEIFVEIFVDLVNGW